MISLNTWTTLFEGKYGSQELSILHSDDYFVSFLKSRDQDDILVQVYKIFAVFGDVEIFAETLPHQCVLYEKHLNIGEKNTYKFFILNSSTEYIDSNTISYHVDKKIQELNKLTSSIISIIKSYDLKLTSLKVLPKEYKNYFFSDPMLIKVLTNMPKSAEMSGITSIDKLLLGKKNNVTVNTTLENLRATLVVGSNIDSRAFALKLISEIYLLSSKKTFIFDDTGVFKSLAYPQQYEDVLQEYDPTLGAFGFPSRSFDYFNKFKIPLGVVPKLAFNYIFKFTGISQDIINKVYTDDLLTIENLIDKVKKIEINDETTDFEKKRLITKLLIINKKYKDYFGNTKVNMLFESRYRHLGASKIITIDKKDPFYVYFIYGLLKEISAVISEEILLVIPECKEVLNNSFIGADVLSILKENPKINYLLSTEYITDFKNTDFADVKIEMIKNNDAVIRYPDRDPLRLLLRPTLSSSNIELKSSKDI